MKVFYLNLTLSMIVLLTYELFWLYVLLLLLFFLKSIKDFLHDHVIRENDN